MKLTDTIRAAWEEPELRQRILFIFLMFGVYAIGVFTPTPVAGVRPDIIEERIKNLPLWDFINLFGGGALGRVSVFSLGLNPYITASIIMQLMTVAIPQLKKEMQEGGLHERMKRAQRTRFLTIVLCVFQAIGILHSLGQGLDLTPWAKVQVILVWTAGAMMVLWLGEQIQEKGIGQGVSLMIFAGIVVSFPNIIANLVQEVREGIVQPWQVFALLAIFLVMTGLIVLFTQAQRRITIQHMRRAGGGRLLQAQSTYLPIPVNAAGVIPIIFAFALVFMPAQFASFAPPDSGWFRFWNSIASYLNPTPGTFWYQWVIGSLVYGLLIFFFTYFWTSVSFDVKDIASHLKRSGAYIPGVRQGRQTEDYLDHVITRVTFVGALFLAFVALVPYWVPSILHVRAFRLVGGTSLLIIVSVVLDLMRQIEANLIMRGYSK